jgi:aminoglycoside phosphotransferase (APT) family kinase protein
MNSSPQPWAAERVVDPVLAKALIESQFPDLAPTRLEPFGEGWDNTAYQVNGRLVFRFPRRQIAVPLIETECRVLPRIAPNLPLPIPVPRYLGRPAEEYPWPFAGYERIPGHTADRLGLDDRQRAEFARPLGRFLSTLHALPAGDVGGDTIGRLNVERLAVRIRRLPEGIESIVEESLGLRPGPRTVLAHGDLYLRHLLVDDAVRLTGVIDWGDVHANDPAVDLSVAWSFLPAAARPAFREAYGPIEDSSWRLARLRALHYGVVLLDYGQGTNDPSLVREARTILRLVAQP